MGLDALLARVSRPGRYTGGEWNSVTKDWAQAQVKVALAFPDVYEVGMSNLGLAILYDIVNRQPGVLAERVYAPWGDLESELRQAGLPLFSLESRRPLREFDILGFSLAYELTYTNILNMLDLAGIPLPASERDASYPLVIAGGTSALNPEPMADFFDLFVLGEGEEVLLELIAAFRRWKTEGGSKEDLLRTAARIPGIYVPSLYQVDYQPDGTVASVTPRVPEAPKRVVRRWVTELPSIGRPMVPYLQVVHDRAAVEIQRGCPRGCRFCQAGITYRPSRQRSPQDVLQRVKETVDATGYEEVSLVSLSSSDYPEIENLVWALRERYRSHPLSLSLPSLRMDSFSLGLAEALADRKPPSLTFAPEAGSERLRRAINKDLSDEEVLGVVKRAADRGWHSVKLYFMLGLPTETDEDVAAIGTLVKQLSRLLQVRVNLATFVPKAHTPFQWVAQDRPEAIAAKQEIVRQGLRKAGAQPSWPDPAASLLEAVFSRGDRRLGQVVLEAWRQGCRFDAWSECFRPALWQAAFEKVGLDPSFYAHRKRKLDEVFPWSAVDVGVSPAFLKRELRHALAGEETPGCGTGPCAACGLQRWSPACRARVKEGQ